MAEATTSLYCGPGFHEVWGNINVACDEILNPVGSFPEMHRNLAWEADQLQRAAYTSNSIYPNIVRSGTTWQTDLKTAPHKGIMKTAIEDIKAFIHEHRSIIYFIVILLIIDHFFLGDRLKDRLKAMAEKMFGAVERKLDRAVEAPKT